MLQENPARFTAPAVAQTQSLPEHNFPFSRSVSNISVVEKKTSAFVAEARAPFNVNSNGVPA